MHNHVVSNNSCLWWCNIKSFLILKTFRSFWDALLSFLLWGYSIDLLRGNPLQDQWERLCLVHSGVGVWWYWGRVEGVCNSITHIYRSPILYPRGDQCAPAHVRGVAFVQLSALYQLAVEKDGDDAGLYGHAECVPLSVEQGVQVTALEGVMQAVLQQAQGGELNHFLGTVHHNRHLCRGRSSCTNTSDEL